MIKFVPQPPEPVATDLTPADLRARYGQPSITNVSARRYGWWAGTRYIEWHDGKIIEWERPEPVV